MIGKKTVGETVSTATRTTCAKDAPLSSGTKLKDLMKMMMVELHIIGIVNGWELLPVL